MVPKVFQREFQARIGQHIKIVIPTVNETEGTRKAKEEENQEPERGKLPKQSLNILRICYSASRLPDFSHSHNLFLQVRGGVSGQAPALEDPFPYYLSILEFLSVSLG